MILTVVDCFSMAAHFMPLSRLPSAAETGNLLMHHVSRLHGLPRNIVTDREPQFTSRVWRAFCATLGTSVSLSSGHHPQFNSQVEQTNQSLKNTLRCMSARHPTAWSSHLP